MENTRQKSLALEAVKKVAMADLHACYRNSEITAAAIAHYLDG